MNLLRLALVFGFILPAISHAGSHRDMEGSHVGGGDAIACDAGLDFQSRGGLYSLDYAVAVGNGMHARDFASFDSWQESSLRIANILKRVSTDLESGFENFVSATEQIGKTDPPSMPIDVQKIRWWSDKAGKDDIIAFDPKRGDLSALPQSCHANMLQLPGKPAPVDGLQLVRIVERTSTTYVGGMVTGINYGYDLNRLVPMFAENPLSASFFMVHEWLWDLTDDIQVSRAVNIFLHSRQIDSMSDLEIQLKLRLIGLQF